MYKRHTRKPVTKKKRKILWTYPTTPSKMVTKDVTQRTHSRYFSGQNLRWRLRISSKVDIATLSLRIFLSLDIKGLFILGKIFNTLGLRKPKNRSIYGGKGAEA
jgi:hypothetical protein